MRTPTFRRRRLGHIIEGPQSEVGEKRVGLCGKEFTIRQHTADAKDGVCATCVDLALIRHRAGGKRHEDHTCRLAVIALATDPETQVTREFDEQGGVIITMLGADAVVEYIEPPLVSEAPAATGSDDDPWDGDCGTHRCPFCHPPAP